MESCEQSPSKTRYEVSFKGFHTRSSGVKMTSMVTRVGGMIAMVD